MKKDFPMYISLKDSCAKGFNKWANTYQPEIRNDLGTNNGSVAESPNQDIGDDII
jgi:hypothetical protein